MSFTPFCPGEEMVCNQVFVLRCTPKGREYVCWEGSVICAGQIIIFRGDDLLDFYLHCRWNFGRAHWVTCR